MKKNQIALCLTTLLITQPSSAGVMRHDTYVQDYRDFAENLGKYRAGATNIAVYKKNGELDDYLNFSMPDLSSVSRRGFATLVSPSYVMSVSHVTNLNSAFFGGASEFAPRYNFVKKYAFDGANSRDFMSPRLNKVVTEVVPVERVEQTEFRREFKKRYTAFVRVGSGGMSQVNDDQTGFNSIAGAYEWLAGGTLHPNAVGYSSRYLLWTQHAPGSEFASPLSISTQSGDSGSPYYAYDSIDQKWKLIAVHSLGTYITTPYGRTGTGEMLPDNYLAEIIAANTSPDVIDGDVSSVIFWNAASINQGVQSWGWQGLAAQYAGITPAKASMDELSATKDLRFNGAGGDIVLSDSVNLGAGKLHFSNNYTLKSADGVNASWAGGGVEVDGGKTVLWQVNGVADDDLHKIGSGTLHINAKGNNLGGLNIGDGTVILDQQADANGNQQAAARLSIVSGRPTVVLKGDNQVAGDNIFFGYHGGKLDLSGHSLQMKTINHTDGGAWLVNSNRAAAANLTLHGYQADDVKIQEWISAKNGIVGDIYEDFNSRTNRIEYFQLKTASYSYFPTDNKDNQYWKYLGFDATEAQQYRARQLNNLVYRGYLGDSDLSAVNGEMNLTFNPLLADSKLALVGGFNLNGDINVTRGTLLLSGQPVPHAGGVIVDGDWYNSSFLAKNISIADDAQLQVGEYAQVKTNITAGNRSQVLLGYNQSLDAQQRILRCTAAVNTSAGTCDVADLDDEQQRLLPASIVHGDITLGDDAALYLGKVQYRGAVHGQKNTRMTLDGDALWNLTANSRVKQLKTAPQAMISLLSDSETRWSPKQLWVEHLDATQLQLALGIAPESGLSDSLYIDKTATGGGNTLDVSFVLDEKLPESVPNSLVLLDAPQGTAHDYFTLPAVKRGFSVYTPNYQVIDANGRVQWVMLATPKPVIDPVPVVKPVPTVDPVPVIDPVREVKPEPVVDPAPVTKPEPTIDPVTDQPGNWFVIDDNQQLINSTRDLLATRDYLFNEAVADLHHRTQTLRQTGAQRSAWVNVSHNQGGVRDVDVQQQTLALGVDNGHYGVMASYAKGNAKGFGGISHQLSNVGTYATWQSPTGYFVDLAASYLHLRQDLQLDGGLAIDGTQRSSHMLAASTKTGYAFSFAQDRWALTPYLQLAGGYQSGYALAGDDVRIGLSSGAPWSLTPGIELKGQLLPGLMLNAGISRAFAPGNSGAILTLEDSRASRVYNSWRDERYRVELGIRGQIADNWSFNLSAQRSFGGTFRTDAALNGGIAYQF